MHVAAGARRAPRQVLLLVAVSSLGVLSVLSTNGAGAADERAGRTEERVEEARTLVELLRRVEARYRELGPFRLTFEQAYDSPSFGVDETDRGTIHVDPPSRMLWDYDVPRGQRAVMNGTTWWLVEPDLRQILRRDRPAGATDPLIDLLAGTLDLLRVFSARPSVEPPGEPGRVVVELVPREPRDDVELAIAEIEAESGDLRRLEVIDPLGGRLLVRLGPPVRTGVPRDERFRVDVPEGWTLIRD